MWIEREMASVLRERAGQRPSLLLTGCRQSGKSTLLEKVFAKHHRVNLDSLLSAEQAQESPRQFLEAHPPPLLLDEIQRAPGLFRELKVVLDDKRPGKGAYVMTGSQKFSLMQGVTESLAGRIGLLELHTCSLKELERAFGDTAEGDRLTRWMWMGGYPEIHGENLPVDSFYSDYVATYLERDVRQILKVGNLRDFGRFMRLAALRTGQRVSYTALATDLGISLNTVRSWMSVLEASNVVALLEPYFNNRGKRLVKTPKLYFLDTGLACHLAGVDSPATLERSGMVGPFFETLVFGQMVRWHTNRGLRPSLYFWRDVAGREVDFVVAGGPRLRLIECKWAESPGDYGKGFDAFAATLSPEAALTRVLVTRARGSWTMKNGVLRDDAVDLKSLG
jgi:predicted AAA+ superfamily ATPase